mgnify:CR=1 FL=1
MQQQRLDEAILRKTGEPIGATPELGPWREFINRRKKAKDSVNIGLVGKYDLLTRAFVKVSLMLERTTITR